MKRIENNIQIQFLKFRDHPSTFYKMHEIYEIVQCTKYWNQGKKKMLRMMTILLLLLNPTHMTSISN